MPALSFEENSELVTQSQICVMPECGQEIDPEMGNE